MYHNYVQWLGIVLKFSQGEIISPILPPALGITKLMTVIIKFVDSICRDGPDVTSWA